MPGAIRSRNGDISFKVVLLGEGAVGKTSIVLRYIENKFNDNHLTTLQASFLNKKLNIDGKRLTLSLWDTAGQERFHALGPIYYRDSNGVLLVYDITDNDSFVKVKNWVKELRRMLGHEVCLCIIGNKIDMDNDRNVSLEEAEQYANEVSAFHFQTSAKLGKGVQEIFHFLAKNMLEVYEKAECNVQNTMADGEGSNRTANRRNVLIVEDDDADSTNKDDNSGSCCK